MRPRKTWVQREPGVLQQEQQQAQQRRQELTQLGDQNDEGCYWEQPKPARQVRYRGTQRKVP